MQRIEALLSRWDKEPPVESYLARYLFGYKPRSERVRGPNRMVPIGSAKDAERMRAMLGGTGFVAGKG